jgi:hypothetical protein
MELNNSSITFLSYIGQELLKRLIYIRALIEIGESTSLILMLEFQLA